MQDGIPVAFTATFLLHLLRISIDVTRLGKVAREMFFGGCSAVSERDVVTVVGFMGTGHYRPDVSYQNRGYEASRSIIVLEMCWLRHHVSL